MIKSKKRVYAIFVSVLCLLFALYFSATASAADKSINIVINGNTVIFTDSSGYPFIDENGRTMVPLRVTMEAAGAVVGWDQAKQTAIVITEHDRIEVPIGANYLYNNNVKIENDTNAVVKNGRTYLPIRAVLESADFTVEWDNVTRTVNAYTFKVDESTFVPYSTSSLETLIKNILNGNVVYMNGQYYATPDYMKMLRNTQVYYTGDDLNIAIYPEDSRYELADIDASELMKEQMEFWISEDELSDYGIRFKHDYPSALNIITGFYLISYMSDDVLLYAVPSFADNDLSYGEIKQYDGVTIRKETGVSSNAIKLFFYIEELRELCIIE